MPIDRTGDVEPESCTHLSMTRFFGLSIYGLPICIRQSVGIILLSTEAREPISELGLCLSSLAISTSDITFFFFCTSYCFAATDVCSYLYRPYYRLMSQVEFPKQGAAAKRSLRPVRRRFQIKRRRPLPFGFGVKFKGGDTKFPTRTRAYHTCKRGNAKATMNTHVKTALPY